MYKNYFLATKDINDQGFCVAKKLIFDSYYKKSIFDLIYAYNEKKANEDKTGGITWHSIGIIYNDEMKKIYEVVDNIIKRSNAEKQTWETIVREEMPWMSDFVNDYDINSNEFKEEIWNTSEFLLEAMKFEDMEKYSDEKNVDKILKSMNDLMHGKDIEADIYPEQ